MSTFVLPSLPGLAWPVIRSSQWQTRKPQSISGKETSIADWSYPRYTWNAVFNTLRQGAFDAQTWTEFATLFGFFNARLGGQDSFQYMDAMDNAVTGQLLGTTSTAANAVGYQLARAFGVFVEPVFAPNLSQPFTLRLNGTPVNASYYTVQPWQSTTPGPGVIVPVLGGGNPWGNGQQISADFSYYWPVRFVDDKCDFEQFDAYRVRCKKLQWMSIK